MPDLSDTANVGPVWTIWYGGGNYSQLDAIDNVERWDTLEDALIEAENRKGSGHHYACDFPYAHKPHERALTPCVDDTSRVEVFLADPVTDYDGSTIPDAVFEWDEDEDTYTQAGEGDFVTR